MMKYLTYLFAFLITLQVAGADFPEPHKSFEYKDTPQGKLMLHAYFPKDWKASDKRPAAVFFHGGGWARGTYKDLTPQAEYLAAKGLVGFSAEYRIGSKHKTTAAECVMDGKSAIRWIRSHAADLGVDPDKIIAGGGSAGGHVAAATATTTSFVDPNDDLSISCIPQALVLLNPVIDNSKDGYGNKKVKDYWKEISPLHNIKKGIPPTLFLCGTNDRFIPVATGELFKQKIETVGGRCDLVWFEDQKHGFFKKKFQESMSEIDKFLVSLGYL